MIEVELKAWIDDPAAVEAALAARFRFVGDYRKEDLYFRLGPLSGQPSDASIDARAPRPPAAEPIEFRLRIENGAAIVTSKEKRMDMGIEVNRETEFEVSDPRAFEAFAQYLGARPFVRKVKVGRLYEAAAPVAGGSAPRSSTEPSGAVRSRPIHLELSAVERLGTFLEIEKLVATDEPSAVAAAREEIRGLLASLGISQARIEPRYYIDMLAALDRGETVGPRQAG